MSRDVQQGFREGLALFDRGRVAEAIEIFERCRKEQPDNPHIALNLGHALAAAGDSKRAIGLYRELSDAKDAGMAFAAYWSLADLKGYRFAAEEVQRMQGLADGNPTHPQRYLLMFALGHAYEQQGAFKEALDAFDQANGQLAGERPYPGEAWRRLAESIRTIPRLPVHPESAVKPVPVFIVGMPRSGSTLLEQIIGAHSRAQAVGELPYLENLARSLDQQGGFANTLPRLDAEHCKRGAAAYLRQVEPLLDGSPAVVVDKWPDNFWYVGLIRALFPAAPIINILRDPLDNALGVYKQFFSRGNEHAARLDWIADYWTCYLDVMRHWDALLPGEILHLRYRDLVQSPEDSIRRVLDYCGLDFEEDVLRFHEHTGAVMTPSGQQVRQGINTRAIRSADPYRPHVSEFLPRFDALARQWGQVR